MSIWSQLCQLKEQLDSRGKGPLRITGSIERVPTFDFPLTSLCFLVHFGAFRNSEYIFIEEFRIKYFARFSLALCSVFIGSHRSIILAISPLASSDFLFFPSLR